ncbi:MAG TPA: hypothetical protein VMA95_17930 [Streptosporangiaceae bacterium]|nr:hypothetical protein [Streptosporangiaceae bacterium]
MKTATEPRHRRLAQDQTGGAAGNEKLTAMTGSVLLVLLAIEGLTILRIHELLTIHFFFGMLLIGPVLLKMSSTGYRFARYYTGSAPYVKKGPPPIVLRLLGPVIMATSVGVIGTGVALAFVGPGHFLWLTAHKAFFILWFAATTIHVLWYAPRLPRLLRGDSPHAARARTVLAGAGKRWLLLIGALAAGLVIAVATYHTAGNWLNPIKHV